VASSRKDGDEGRWQKHGGRHAVRSAGRLHIDLLLFRDGGQLFVGALLFLEGGCQQLGYRVMAEFLGPSDEGAIAGDFVVLDGLAMQAWDELAAKSKMA
jgi:hypothetical protein